MEDGNQEPISCEGCKSWRSGVGRCNVDVGKEAKKAKVRLCSFCHGERMRYFRRTWWGEPLPLSALPPPRSPPASPRPLAPGQPAQLAAEAPDAGAESNADTHSQASSRGGRGSHHGGMPPAAATSALDQQMMEQFLELHRRLSTIEAMFAYLLQALQAQGLDMPRAPAGPPATTVRAGPPAEQPWRPPANRGRFDMPPAPAGPPTATAPAGPPAVQQGRPPAMGDEADAAPWAAGSDRPWGF